MQESIMLFFLNIANPTLDFLANIASAVGEQTFVIAVILYIFYNYDKKKGFGLFTSVLFAVLGMGILKAVVRAPRPFQVLESIDGKRLETATGYSFPSGHTTTGAAFYTALALTFKKRPVSILCAVMMALVGLSRLYLGVHWPIDVFAGLLLGVAISFTVSRYLNALYDDKNKRIRLSLWIGSLSFAAGAITAILLNTGTIDEVAFTDLMKVFALGGGGYLGFALENKKVNFTVEEKRSKQIVRYVIGLVGILLFMGAKVIIPESLYAVGSFVRYTLVGLWATGLYPLIGKNLRLFSGSR
ncbi:MAG: phosphatase PAP2 family protein [Sphaerochaeta sp.]|jgi:undecaprenyl-diphosphatase|uniref:phosphatase PAP2 family protein n=1 Tax=Sphaerochaeta sp. TaxID=1972642 RepID=UPI0017D8FF5A|nr:phosphatase PAP2 family protein [Sphaerochaeta sp.]MDD4039208.1 phosphatase PAP2 family protein [Sphaerochaeta sp.]MDX9985024.1 phosphatase PAP2 family protein [Sphaerochaeta sp.]NLA98829.1 phosphatase PAP2 family protein [Spirochaetales bacterium]